MEESTATTGNSVKSTDFATHRSIKFLCSYGGKIVTRVSDSKLRYHGGHTRVLAVDRSIKFPELLLKLGDLCGSSVILRCQLPTEDLDALVSIKTDEDLANIIEEYDRIGSLKVRAFIFQPRPVSGKGSPPPSDATSPNSVSTRSSTSSSSSTCSFSFSNFKSTSKPLLPVPRAMVRCLPKVAAIPATQFPLCYETSDGNGYQYGYYHYQNGYGSNMCGQ